MSDLDDLKTLLFGAEKQVLDSIQQRVQRPEARAADIAAVLPEAVRLSHREDDELVASLKSPVGRVLRDSFHESPQEFGDALYPVMGPAIRKSIAHTLKAFAQQINQTLEYSLTLKGLKWRLEAARAGVPFAHYLIQRSLKYRVEQAYLISRENGLLIAHVHHDASRIKDSDAVSAMFTAIQDFVKESFSPDRSGRLETADMGEFTLWAVHGPHALLVCVIRGVPPADLRTDLTRILEQLHFRYGDAVREYAGDTATVAGVEEELERCLAFEARRPEEQRGRRKPWPLIIATLALIAVLAWSGWLGWQESERRARLETAVAATPGLYVGRIERDGDGYRLHGLRDPLAADLDDVAGRAGLAPGTLRGELSPYVSLDEPLRLARARAALAPPADVAVTLENGELVVSGTAPAEWIASARSRAQARDFGWPVAFRDLSAAEWPPLSRRAAELDGAHFYFAEDAELTEASAAELARYAAALGALAADAEAFGATLSVRVTGHTDGVGSLEWNNQLADRRAAAVVAALADAGTRPGTLTTVSRIPDAGTASADPELRRASVTIELAPPP